MAIFLTSMSMMFLAKTHNGEQDVSGELTDDRGETKEFEGIWVGNGLITG